MKASFFLFLLFVSAGANAASSDCLEQGGNRVCISDFSYNLCDYQGSSCSAYADFCRALGGTWVAPHGCGGATYCPGAQKLTEANIDEISRRAFIELRGAGSCPIQEQDSGWGAQWIDSSLCWTVWPQQQNGVETQNARVWTFTGHSTLQAQCDRPVSLTMVGRRDRVLACPPGYKYSYENGETICWKENDQTCPVNNPVQPGTGAKVHVEVDFAPASPGGLKFVRTYNSHPFVQPRTVTGALPRMFGKHWTASFERRVFPITGAQQVSAVALRDDGQAKYFDHSGNELQHDRGARERLVQTTNGWTYENREDEVELYDASGRLTSIARPDGTDILLTYDSEGRLERVSDSYGRSLVFTWNLGSVFSVEDPNGQRVEYTLDQNASLTEVKYPATPLPRTYVYGDPAGTNTPLLTQIHDENGDYFAKYDYDSGYRVYRSVHAPLESGGNINKYLYSYATDATTMTSPLGGQTTFGLTRTDDGVIRQSSLSHPCTQCGGSAQSTSYDGLGYKDLVTDFAGVVTDHDYDARGLEFRRIEAKSQNGVTNLPEKRTIETDWHAAFRKPVARRTRDADGMLVAQESWTYNSRGQILTRSSIDPDSGQTRTTAWAYCEQSDVTAGTCPRLGLLKSENGPRTDVADVTTYAYYSADHSGCASAPTTCAYRKGDLWKVTNALGHVSEILRYDGAGRVLSTQNANGVITDLEYHARGWLTARKVRGADDATESDDAITRLEYWPTGQVKRVTQPGGDFLGYEYDVAHRLTAVQDALGNRIEYTLDDAGNRTAEATKNNAAEIKRQLSRVFDQLGRLDLEQNAAAQTVADHGYDAADNNTNTADGLGHETRRSYDALNRLKQTIDAYNEEDATTGYDYDSLDRLTGVTDPRGLQTSYVYDGLGDLKQLSSPDTGVTNYLYDSAGNRTSKTDARGIAEAMTYDALNRPKFVTYPTASQNIAYSYDEVQPDCAAGETFAVGFKTRMTDESGETRFCYDRLGNVSRKVQVTAGVTMSLRYGYDLAGRLTTLTYPSGTIITYGRNSIGQIVGITRKANVGASPEAIVSNVTYQPFGPVHAIAFASGETTTKEFDADYHVTKIQGSTLTTGLDLGLQWDRAGNLESARRPAVGSIASTWLYSYDAHSRLTQAASSSSGARNTYAEYDPVGNRVYLERWTVPFDAAEYLSQYYEYAPTNNRLAGISDVSRSHDASGNLTGFEGFELVPSSEGPGNDEVRTPRVLSYNSRGRLASFSKETWTNECLTEVSRAGYRFNAIGERVLKELMVPYYSACSLDEFEFIKARFIYDQSGNLLAHFGGDASYVPSTEYVYLDGVVVAVMRGSQTYYVETDHLGTPRAVTDPARNVAVWTWDLLSEPFGADLANEDADGNGVAFKLNLRFPGQYFDVESGLHYNYFRDYEPGTGRYVESDPVGLKGGVSTYGYVVGNPLSYIDPKGLVRVVKQCGGARGVLTCDGKGGFEVRVCDRGCSGVCTFLHELNHGVDYSLKYPNGCRDVPKGGWAIDGFAYEANNFGYRSECAAHRLGKKCATLIKDFGWPVSCECKDDVEKAAGADDRMMEYYKCGAYGW